MTGRTFSTSQTRDVIEALFSRKILTPHFFSSRASWFDCCTGIIEQKEGRAKEEREKKKNRLAYDLL